MLCTTRSPSPSCQALTDPLGLRFLSCLMAQKFSLSHSLLFPLSRAFSLPLSPAFPLCRTSLFHLLPLSAASFSSSLPSFCPPFLAPLLAVTPIVGFLGDYSSLPLKISEDEISHVFCISLPDIADPDKQTDDVMGSSRHGVPLRVFNAGPYPVWGLTCMLLTSSCLYLPLFCYHSSSGFLTGSISLLPLCLSSLTAVPAYFLQQFMHEMFHKASPPPPPAKL